MRKIMVVLMILVLAACAELKVAADIVDIFVPDPPKCNKENVGTYRHGGDLCVKYVDGTYGWQAWTPKGRAK
jgi:hypothetical protein